MTDSDFVTMHAWLRYNRARYEMLARRAEREAAQTVSVSPTRRTTGPQVGHGALVQQRGPTLEWSSQR
jgi:hypothetical protein